MRQLPELSPKPEDPIRTIVGVYALLPVLIEFEDRYNHFANPKLKFDFAKAEEVTVYTECGVQDDDTPYVYNVCQEAAYVLRTRLVLKESK